MFYDEIASVISPTDPKQWYSLLVLFAKINKANNPQNDRENT